MRTLPLVALAALAALTLVAPSQAATTPPCYTTSEPTQVVKTPGTPTSDAQTYYVIVDSMHSSALIYQEDNGLSGLQRHDRLVNDVGHCTDGTVADTRVF